MDKGTEWLTISPDYNNINDIASWEECDKYFLKMSFCGIFFEQMTSWTD